jgi:hypothetical protein
VFQATSSRRRGGEEMEGKAKLIFPILATGVVVFVASAAVT